MLTIRFQNKLGQLLQIYLKVLEFCSHTTHVFNTKEVKTIKQAKQSWESIKRKEKNLKNSNHPISDILKKYISLESGRFGHRSGRITFSALEPMRAIPYKVIILMGLDNSIFPRSEDRSSYSLLENKRLLGDPKIPIKPISLFLDNC